MTRLTSSGTVTTDPAAILDSGWGGGWCVCVCGVGGSTSLDIETRVSTRRIIYFLDITTSLSERADVNLLES